MAATLETAERFRQKLVGDAQAVVDEQCSAAREAGQAEGFAQAAYMREQIAAMEQRMLREIDGEIVRASLRIAKQLLEAELAERSTALVDLVVCALSTVRDARDVSLRVNPYHGETLRHHKDRLIDALGRARDVVIREDKNVQRGGVLIQTESGVIDAQLDTQLAELARVLAG
ncbi:MAG: FliH/SctL family protein [Myxococcota bacterium]